MNRKRVLALLLVARSRAAFSGERLEQQIAALRQRTFGDDGLTIEREEAQGFFRFERPRLHGRN